MKTEEMLTKPERVVEIITIPLDGSGFVPNLAFYGFSFQKSQKCDKHFYKYHRIVKKTKNRIASALRNSIYIASTMMQIKLNSSKTLEKHCRMTFLTP